MFFFVFPPSSALPTRLLIYGCLFVAVRFVLLTYLLLPILWRAVLAFRMPLFVLFCSWLRLLPLLIIGHAMVCPRRFDYFLRVPRRAPEMRHPWAGPLDPTKSPHRPFKMRAGGAIFFKKDEMQWNTKHISQRIVTTALLNPSFELPTPYPQLLATGSKCSGEETRCAR